MPELAPNSVFISFVSNQVSHVLLQKAFMQTFSKSAVSQATWFGNQGICECTVVAASGAHLLLEGKGEHSKVFPFVLWDISNFRKYLN